MSKPNRFPVKRIAIDAVLIALYFALSWASVEIAGIKLTFVGLASIIAAMVYGPIDGFLVGFLGAFCSSMASPRPRFCGCWDRLCAVWSSAVPS